MEPTRSYEYGAVNNMAAMSPSKASSVENLLLVQLETAHKTATQLYDSIHHLCDRLSPILQPEITSDNRVGASSNPQMESAPAVEYILVLIDTISNCSRRIQDMHNRLAL